MRNTRRAFSLLETTVVLGMFTVALVALGMLLSRSQHLMMRSDARVTAQRAALGASRRLTLALANSPASGVSLTYVSGNLDNLVLGLLSPRTSTGETVTEPGTALPVYQGYSVFYRQPSTRQLKVAWRPLTTPSTSAPALTETELLATTAGGAGNVVAAECTRFQARDLTSGTPLAIAVNPMRLAVVVKSAREDVAENDFPVRCRY